MDAETILDAVIRGTLASRGKSARGATWFLTGGRHPFLNASTLLAAAGVAWGLYEAATQKTAAPATTGPAAAAPAPPPPLPTAAGGPSPELLRLVQLMISAARADGELSLEERGAILEHARAAGGEALVAPEIQMPRPLGEIVAGVADDALRRDLYVLAFTVVRADEAVSGAERIYLAQLAHHLGLDPAVAAQLESETAARIDAGARTAPGRTEESQ